ncbi:mavicyanin-like [Forsythia ovata]|uniref:Mavicyanin-like n=1 Tax=Forsythia ovata TaxID=205694 RepID=A0ABD1R690_9LAMI
MGGDKVFRSLLLVVVLVAVASGAQEVEGQVHHVVGGDRRWEPASDISSWLSGRIFRVGDKIWFTNSAPQESILELQSQEEFQSCDVSNPIKMYTDGVNQIPLEREGNMYFVIGNQENCNNGLKLHVDVKPSEPHAKPFPYPEPKSYPPKPEPSTFPVPTSYPPPSPEPKPFPYPVPKSYPPPSPEPKPFPYPVPTSYPPPTPDPKPFPPAPSGSTQLNGLLFGLFVGFLLCFLSL